MERWQEDRRATQQIESERVIEAIGHPLFGPAALWEEAAKEVAARLGWPREGSTQLESSDRSYPDSS